MSRNLPRFLLIFSLALNVGFLAFFLHPLVFGFPEHRPPRFPTEEVIASLDLPADTEQSLRELMEDFGERLHANEEALQTARVHSLEVLATPGPLDEEGLERNKQELMELREERLQMLFAHAQSVEVTLGPELRTRFFSFLLEHLQERHGPGPGPGEGPGGE